jgi:hypothetical protein
LVEAGKLDADGGERLKSQTTLWKDAALNADTIYTSAPAPVSSVRPSNVAARRPPPPRKIRPVVLANSSTRNTDLFAFLSQRTATYERRLDEGEIFVKSLDVPEEYRDSSWQQQVRSTMAPPSIFNAHHMITDEDIQVCLRDRHNDGFGATTNKFGTIHPTKLAVASAIKIWAHGKDSMISAFMMQLWQARIPVSMDDIPLPDTIFKLALAGCLNSMDNFRIIEILGSGAYGCVAKCCFSPFCDYLVAIKFEPFSLGSFH